MDGRAVQRVFLAHIEKQSSFKPGSFRVHSAEVLVGKSLNSHRAHAPCCSFLCTNIELFLLMLLPPLFIERKIKLKSCLIFTFSLVKS